MVAAGWCCEGEDCMGCGGGTDCDVCGLNLCSGCRGMSTASSEGMEKDGALNWRPGALGWPEGESRKVWSILRQCSSSRLH